MLSQDTQEWKNDSIKVEFTVECCYNMVQYDIITV